MPLTCLVPMLTIGSTAITRPGSQREIAVAAQLRADEIRHLRLFVHLAADAVADEILDDRKPGVADVGSHFARPLRSSGFACPSARSPGRARRLVTSSSRCTSGSILPTGCVMAESPHQPFSLQPVSMLTTSPSFSARVPGNAVHHFVVDRDAGDGRKGNLAGHALEQRHGVVLVEELVRWPRRFRRS